MRKNAFILSALFFLLGIGALWAQYPAGYFYMIFRNDTFCVRPVITDSVTEAEWFNYTSSSMHTGFESAYETHYFFFYNPMTGNMGFVIQHNIDAGGTADAICDLWLDSLPPGCTFAMSDDMSHSHSHSTGRACGSAQEFNLSCYPQGGWWWYNNSDGGAFYLPRAEFEFSLRSIFGGTDPILMMYFLSGDSGEDRIHLTNVVVGDEDTVIVGHNFQGILEMQDTLDIGCVTLDDVETVYVPVCNSDVTSDTFHFGAIYPPDYSYFSMLYYPSELAPGECDSIVILVHPPDTGEFSGELVVDLNTPCDSFRTLTLIGDAVRGGLYPVWFYEETDCDSQNVVTICYEFYECDPANIQVRISADGGFSYIDAGTGWFTTFLDSAGDIGANIEPGVHCFDWLMSEDIDTESCYFIVQVIANNAVFGYDTGYAAGCLDSHHPDIAITCPSFVYAGSLWTFHWTVTDMFWDGVFSDYHLFGCGIDEHYLVSSTSENWSVPLISCPSCTLVIAAFDSFCNFGYDTCIFEIVCIPYINFCSIREETNCDGENIVTLCYSLFSCDSLPYNFSVELFADPAMTENIPLTTLSGESGDFGSNVYPGLHCFDWYMNIDLPDSESCDFTARFVLNGTYRDTCITSGCLDSRPPDVHLNCPADGEYTTGDSAFLHWTVNDMFFSGDPGTLFIDYNSGIDTLFVADTSVLWEIVPTCDTIHIYAALRDSFCNWNYDSCAFLPCSRLYVWSDCAPCDGATACSTQTISFWVADTICYYQFDTTRIYYLAATYHRVGGYDSFSAIDSLRFEVFGDSIRIILDNLNFADGDSFIFTIDSIFNEQGCITVPR